MVFSTRDRERISRWLLERAQTDPRVVAGAVVGADARGSADRWSDVDLTFGVMDGASIDELLADWTNALDADFDAVELFDLQAGSTVYRVFLLPGNLQVDLSFTPQAQFGARGPDFRLLFGSAVEYAAGERGPELERSTARHLFGLAVHHAVRARFSIERGRPWQAEHWISAMRDQTLTLACHRRGLPSAHGRGFDRLPAELLARVEPTLIRSLDQTELLRGLDAAIEVLLLEAEEAHESAGRLAPRLRELAAATFIA